MSKERVKRQAGEVHGFNRVSFWLHRLLTNLLSSFRLSLTFRIAIHYCWQLMRTFLLSLLMITCFYAGPHVSSLIHELEHLKYLPLNDERLHSGTYVGDIPMQVELLMQSSSEDTAVITLSGVSFHFSFSQATLTALTAHSSGYILCAKVSLSFYLTVWTWLMMALVTCDVLRMIFFIRHRQRLDKSVLLPIRDITDMAATLSASNLSNRINIAGTKNELKDLAVVINSMLDRIERSYNSQKQFVSDASHELRTPIAVIQGYISMLHRWGKDDKTVLEESIAAIAQETASMKDLVENLLFLARHDKKTLMMEIEQFDPCEVMQELHREATMVTPEDTFEFAPADHCLIEGDRNMIKQVLRILCDNAVKYTPKGGKIIMGVQRQQDGCTLFIKDTGAGISEEELPKIFDRFYRSDSARKAESGGHGLGLSIARIIVVAHSGKIKVYSKLGVGTTFCVILPAKQTNLHTATLQKNQDKTA